MTENRSKHVNKLHIHSGTKKPDTLIFAGILQNIIFSCNIMVAICCYGDVYTLLIVFCFINKPLQPNIPILLSESQL
ncbi:hypothetical protein ANN_14231 [Periplaneta americana]|uniref:Transmembrane protein n=1 Tax=Periplaneta americana TaxID=6978 RepID=A0ABQ8SX84_PERAM|nr:hypothetical protein ANN_14231 [Periplaneta americana]